MNDPDFQPELLDTGFRQWDNSGISGLKDLFSQTTVATFEQTIEKYHIPRQDSFRYLQIRHYILHSTMSIDNPERSPAEKLFQAAVTLQRLRGTWEWELSVTINEEEWEDIWRRAKSATVCSHAQAIQLRIIHRMHASPNRRHQLNPTLCKIEIVTLTHCL